MAPSPTYDAKGNTLTLPRANGTSQSLTWDAHNRLRSVTPSGSAARTMVYDPLGRLVWSRRPDGANPAIDEVLSWSSWTLLAREIYQGITALETYRYTWGPDLSGTLEGAGGVGGLLAEERAVGSSTVRDIRHTHADANGNILALTNATGQVSARYRYSPFGETLSNQDLDGSGWATKNIHRFSTKPEIAGTVLLYYGYRYYDPQTGRWPSRDPIEEAGGLNLYGFVGNNSISRDDYLGLCSKGESRIDEAKVKSTSATDSEEPDGKAESAAGKFLTWLFKKVAGAGDQARPRVPNQLDAAWGWKATVKYNCCECVDKETIWISKDELKSHGEPFASQKDADSDGEQGLSDLKDQVSCN